MRMNSILKKERSTRPSGAGKLIKGNKGEIRLQIDLGGLGNTILDHNKGPNHLSVPMVRLTNRRGSRTN